jgi:hypothetical protein
MPPTICLATPDDAEQVQAIYTPYCHTPISSGMRSRVEGCKRTASDRGEQYPRSGILCRMADDETVAGRAW